MSGRGKGARARGRTNEGSSAFRYLVLTLHLYLTAVQVVKKGGRGRGSGDNARKIIRANPRSKPTSINSLFAQLEKEASKGTFSHKTFSIKRQGGEEPNALFDVAPSSPLRPSEEKQSARLTGAQNLQKNRRQVAPSYFLPSISYTHFSISESPSALPMKNQGYSGGQTQRHRHEGRSKAGS